jgi:hypothetical protein
MIKAIDNRQDKGRSSMKRFRKAIANALFKKSIDQ